MSNDTMTTAEAQTMIEEVLEAERNPVTEGEEPEELAEDAKSPALTAADRVADSVKDFKTALNAENFEEAMLHATNVLSNAGQMVGLFSFGSRRFGFDPSKLVKWAKTFKVPVK